MNLDEFQALVGSAIADPDFERIQLSLREPNIFRALAISRREIRHSNFLAYLFDHHESFLSALTARPLIQIFRCSLDAASHSWY